MIALTPTTFDISAPLVLSAARLDNPQERRRRLSRSATLDGGATVADMGYSAADRTLRIITAAASAEQTAAVATLLESYGSLIVATDEGLFLAAPETMSVRGDVLNLTLLVTEKLA